MIVAMIIRCSYALCYSGHIATLPNCIIFVLTLVCLFKLLVGYLIFCNAIYTTIGFYAYNICTQKKVLNSFCFRLIM